MRKIVLIILIIVAAGVLLFFVFKNKNEDNGGSDVFVQPTNEAEERAESLIVSSEAIADSCKISITTDEKIFFLDTNVDQRTFSDDKNCFDFLINKISPSGKFVVFQDQMTDETILETRIYSLEKDRTFQLDVNGGSEIFDMIFLPDDRLIILLGITGSYNDQYLKIYDLAGIFKNYSKIVNKEQNAFVTIDKYSKKMVLPNMGKDYVGLSTTDEKLIIFGPERVESGIRREINKEIDLSDLIIF